MYLGYECFAAWDLPDLHKPSPRTLCMEPLQMRSLSFSHLYQHLHSRSVHSVLDAEAHLRDIAGLTPHCLNKANTPIK